MERLTERYKDYITNIVLIRECGDKLCEDICNDIEHNCNKCELEKAFEKLATYEDLEEQGLLVRLPCKIGDTVYEIIHDDIPVHIDYICKYTVENISAKTIKFAEEWNPLNSIPNVYFSRDEAEEALRKLKEENHAI
ncbi:MAG: hypothetical protein MSD68_04865 [Blautia sp.]|uniref:hypothetical protein n=1 Tax=Blautia sp. TaxID=1955243 RepID=UPI0025C352A8|nr:hypothetical protein [Blautia sp.]MCI7449040.1 hypothetical protein [Blautia sp.]